MSRAALIALIDHVLLQCGGVTTVGEFAELLNDEHCGQLFLDACRSAAAQPPPPFNAAPPVVVNVMLQVAVPPRPLPPPISLVLQIPVPAAPTATVGIATDRISLRNAQAQTARWLYGTTTTQAVQTDGATHMVDGTTTTDRAIGMVDASTDHYLDRVWLGLVHSAVQTDVAGPVVAAADHDLLGAELTAAVEAASGDRAEADEVAVAAVDRWVQTEGAVVSASEYEQVGAQLEALSARAAAMSAQAAEAEQRAAEDRIVATVDRAVAATQREAAAAEREAAVRDREMHMGVIELLRARLRAREHDWSTS